MRVLIAEQDHAEYQRLLQQAAPQLELVVGEGEALAEQAARCPVWLGEPDLFASALRAGHKPAWLQSTWAGITPLLADDLPRDYLLTRAVGVFGQIMAEYVLCHMLAHERELIAHHMIPLALLARSDGNSDVAEQKIMLDHAVALLAMKGEIVSEQNREALKLYIASLRPSLVQLDPALRRLEQEKPDTMIALLGAARALVMADGRLDPAESHLLDELKLEFAKV